MPDCELLLSCPFFNDRTHDTSEMTEIDKEQYCKGDYAWCGRYMTFQALEKESEGEQVPSGPFLQAKSRTKVTTMGR